MTTLQCPQHYEAALLNHVEIGGGVSVLECVTHISPGSGKTMEFSGCGYWTTLATDTVARLTARTAA